jgi:hypothetical protein
MCENDPANILMTFGLENKRIQINYWKCHFLFVLVVIYFIIYVKVDVTSTVQMGSLWIQLNPFRLQVALESKPTSDITLLVALCCTYH